MNRKFGYASLSTVVLVTLMYASQPGGRMSAQAEKKTNGGRVSVLDYGAVGDGQTDDRAAIQTAIDAGDEIDFPEVRAFYRVVGSLQVGGRDQKGGKRLIGHRPCRGGGPFQGKSALIQGDGSTTLLSAKGTTSQNRALEFVGLSASNAGAAALDLMSGVDTLIDNCWFHSERNTDATMRLRESYNVTLRESAVYCSGGGFAVTAYQQCNALRIQNCRVGGGDLGGAVHIEQSANVQFTGNIVELGVYGLVISSGIRLDQPKAGPVEGAGVCHALRVTSNYFENVQHPMVIASAMNLEQHPGQAVFGAVIESNNLGTYGFDFPLLTIGRLQSASIRGNSFWRKSDGRSVAIHATWSRGATPSHAKGCVIEINHLTNGSGSFFGADDFSVDGKRLIKVLNTDNRIVSPIP